MVSRNIWKLSICALVDWNNPVRSEAQVGEKNLDKEQPLHYLFVITRSFAGLS